MHILSKITTFVVTAAVCCGALFAQESLKEAAKKHGLVIGTCTFGSAYKNQQPYADVLKAQFNAIVAENEMKPDALHRTRGQFSFSTADAMVTWATQNNIKVRGHTLVWHSQNPGWIKDNTWNREEGLAALKEHIEGIVGHFKGKVFEWDVTNECYTDGNNPVLRPTSMNPWRRAIGDDYIDSAFAFAHNADKDAILYYNDFNTSNITPKSTVIYNKVKQMIEGGVPISGIGFQSHQTLEEYTPDFMKSLKDNFERFSKLGLKIAITELDIRITTPTDQSELLKQALYYRDYMKTALDNPACRTFMIWGFTDAHSWVPGTFRGTDDALIYTRDYKPKPACDSLLVVLKTYEPVSVLFPLSHSGRPGSLLQASPAPAVFFTLRGESAGYGSMIAPRAFSPQTYIVKKGAQATTQIRLRN